MRIDTDTIQNAPDAHLFPASARRGKQALTAKQRKFAREVAMGATKADAYRAAYNVTSKHTMSSKPYVLAADERVAAEIQAIQAAITAEHIKNPAALRALVIQSLVTMSLDPNVKDATRLQALKTLGTVSEIAAFTERKEVRTISSSEDARARVLEQLRSIVKADAQDVQAIEADADSLLAELETHRVATPHDGEQESRTNTHTIPLEQSPFSPDSDPTPSPQEDPPSSN
jgi:hypothetical protein